MFRSPFKRLITTGMALSLPLWALVGCGGAGSLVTVPEGAIAPLAPAGQAEWAPTPAGPEAGPGPSQGPSPTPAPVVTTSPVPASPLPLTVLGGSGGGGSGGHAGGGSAAPTPAPSPSPEPAPTPSDGPALPDPSPSAARAPNTTPITNIAGMDAAGLAATNRSVFFDVSPDGDRVAIAWLHNEAPDGSFSATGEPIALATIGNPADPGSFSPPQVIGRRMFEYAPDTTDARKKYNTAHNAPFVLAQPNGGFLGLSLPMNANGYAQTMAATGYGYALSENAPGAGSWSAPGLARLSNLAGGSSLSEMSGAMDPDGNAHMFGQGHLGQFQSGLGYMRRRAGSDTWDSYPLAAALRVGGLTYFGEGGGYVSKVRNAQGRFDIHAAFAWNRQGDSPLWGLSYMVSHDGGDSWQAAGGQPLSVPVPSSEAAAAVVPANLDIGAYGGAMAGASPVTVGATDDGTPLLLRPVFADGANQTVQHHLYTFTGGRWIDVPVGPAVFWNANGSGVAYNAATGKVNVLLLDPGSYARPARILLYSQPLTDLQAGRTGWTEEVVCAVPQSHYASSLHVREVKDTRFVALFEGEYRNPGIVKPVLVEAPMR